MKWFVPDAALNGKAFAIESRANAILQNIPAVVTFVQTGGYYAVGDGGGALFKRVVGPLTDTASFQSADGSWWLICSDTIYVDMFGAKGDGVELDSVAFSYAIAFSNCINLNSTKTYNIANVSVDNKELIINGNGAIVTTDDNINGAFKKTDHGNKFYINNVKFRGSGAGINYIADPSTSSYFDLEIYNCDFNIINNATYAIILDGPRNPQISKCFILGNSGGIYCKDTVQPLISDCVFKGVGYTNTAIDYPGTGTGFDAGLIVNNCEILGWNVGINIVGCDMFVLNGGTVDYNNNSIRLVAQDRAHITGGAYVGSLGNNPAIYIGSDSAISPQMSDKIIIENITLAGHSEVGGYSCIELDGSIVTPRNIQIRNNNITFYTDYGIKFNYLASERLSISGNTFVGRAGLNIAPIYNVSGSNDSGLLIRDNIFGSAATSLATMNLTSNCVNIFKNYNLTLSSKGSTIIVSGNTSVTFNHNITGYVPSVNDVIVTPTNAAAAALSYYVSSITDTKITLSCTSAPGSNAGFSWEVIRSTPN